MSAVGPTVRAGSAPSTQPPIVRVRSLSHWFNGVKAIDNVSLDVDKGQFLSIVGPTGCGKTTLLYVLAGLEELQEGEVAIDGKSPKAGRNEVGYAFPRDALLPWRTALENVALPLELRGVRRESRLRRAASVLETVGLSSSQNNYRAQLSQGMRQRVALARTLVSEPSILFMDEPFGALDAQTRVLMQNELLSLLTGRDATVVFITHDLDEAISLSDHVVVLSQRPCRILKEVAVPFERPRSMTELRRDGRYQELYTELWETLRDEVAVTFGGGGEEK